jgi:hypothetical protein
MTRLGKKLAHSEWMQKKMMNIAAPEIDAKVAEQEQRNIDRGMSSEQAAEMAAMTRAAVADPKAFREQMFALRDAVKGDQTGPVVVGAGGISALMAQAAANNPPPDKLEQLQKLAELRATGALTEEEFEQQKHRILGAG